MSDLRRPSLRLALVLTLAVVALVETLGLLQGLRSQGRLRARVAAAVRSRLADAAPGLRSLVAPGGPAAWDAVAASAIERGLATEVEVFDGAGRELLSRPTPPPVAHWPTGEEMDRFRRDGLLVVLRQSGLSARALAYLPVLSGTDHLVLRLASREADLEDDFRERQQVLVGRAVALAFLIAAIAITLLPAGPPAEGPAPRVLDAYEEAMGRLKEQGREMSLRHDEERRHLEEVIRDKEAMARAGELTAGVVHEMRNGLGTVVGYARLVERESPSAAARDAAKGILAECETLETVVRRFMDFVKHESLQAAPLDLGRMLRRVVGRELRHSSAKAQLQGLEEPGALVADEELLERAFENLVRNAAEAAGDRGHVFVDVISGAEDVVVRVGDDGPGMPKSERDDLRPFFTTKAGGLGLGLPIAFKIVRLHGGEMTLADRSPRGLSVSVRLPRQGPAV